MKLTGAQKTLFGVLLTAVFFTGMGSASYYFGVKTIDTEGIAKLNTGIAGIKQQLADANASNSTLTTKLSKAQYDLDSANTDKSALQVALKSKFTDIATKLGIDLSSYADADFTNPDKMTTLLQTINDKISADSGSGDNSQQALDDHLKDLVALANLMKITVDTGTLADGSKLPADSFTLPATTKKITDVQYVVSQGASDLQKQVASLQSAMKQLNLPFDPNSSNPAQAVTNAINAVIQDTTTKVVTQVTGLVNSVGIDVSWLTLGPSYHAIDSPNTLFGVNVSDGLNFRQIPVVDESGNTVMITVPGLDSGGTVTGNPMIWNGFGWFIYNSNTNEVYTEKTNMENGQPVAAGVGWVKTTDLMEQVTMPDGQKRVVLWGSAQHQFVKALVPDFGTIPNGKGGANGQGKLYWSDSTTAYYKPYDTQNNPSYSLNFLPGGDGAADSSLYENLAVQLNTQPKDNRQPVWIQKQSIFKQK